MPHRAKGVTLAIADRLLESYEGGPSPPIGPDGAPVIPPVTHLPLADESLWLCLKGPCRRYHRLVTSLDAVRPLDGTPVAEHRQIAHSCYPASGVEVDLGDVVVYECSLWDPEDPASKESRDLERRRALALGDLAPVPAPRKRK